MKLRFFRAILCLALTAPLFAQKIDIKPPAGGIDLPTYTRTTLPNGLVVLLMERPGDQLVHARLVIRSGSAADPAGKEGIASLTAALLTTGTPTRTAEQIASEVDFAGGQLAAEADRDGTEVTAEFLARDLKTALDLMSDVVVRPSFATAEVERVRAQRVAEIAAAKEDPGTFATSEFEAALFANTRYAHSPIGRAAAISSITRDDVVAFHRTRYAPNDAVLAIVGGIRSAQALQLVRSTFSGWQRRTVSPVTVGKPGAVSGRNVIVVDSPGMNQTQVRLGTTGIRRGDPDFVAISVANAILSTGFSSRLTEEIRVNRSLTYSIRSIFDAWAQTGPWSVATFTRNATTREIIDATLGELKKFRDGPIKDSELTRAKNIVLSRTLLGLESPEGVARMLTTIEIHGLPRDYVETLASKVQALTVDSLSKIIRDRYRTDDLILLVYTTASETEKQLEGLGKVRKTAAN